jgi:hypothetical protein
MLCAIAFNDIHVTCTIDLSVDGVDPEEVQTLPAFTSPFGNTSDPMAIMTDTLRGVRPETMNHYPSCIAHTVAAVYSSLTFDMRCFPCA